MTTEETAAMGPAAAPLTEPCDCTDVCKLPRWELADGLSMEPDLLRAVIKRVTRPQCREVTSHG